MPSASTPAFRMRATTVARGYVEAQTRDRGGSERYIRARPPDGGSPMARHPEIVDLSIDLPPEHEALDRMQDASTFL